MILIEPVAPLISNVYAMVAIGLPALLSPLLMAWLVGRQARTKQADDYKRQDQLARESRERDELIAKKAAEVAAVAAANAAQAANNAQAIIDQQKEVAAQAAVTADLLLQNNKKIATASKEHSAKLDQIHTLVNSNLTAAMEEQLDARKLVLALLVTSMAQAQHAGKAPLADMVKLHQETKDKIAELEAELVERLKQTSSAEKQLAVDLARPSSVDPVEVVLVNPAPVPVLVVTPPLPEPAPEK